MKRLFLTAALAAGLTAGLTPAAHAHNLLGGLLGGLGVGHHGGFVLGWGHGLGGFSFDAQQSYFEMRLDALETDYSEGVATGDDYFETDDYDSLLGKTERLSDRYGLFVDRVDVTIDALDSWIMNLNDRIADLDDLLAEFQSRGLPAARLERIEGWITRISDALTLKSELASGRLTDLQADLVTYQAFQIDLGSFLTSVTNMEPLATAEVVTATTVASGTLRASESLAAAIGVAAAPEPAAAALVAAPLLAVGLRRRGRR